MPIILKFFALALVFLPSFALACPLCHTTTAEEVRAGIFATASDATVVLALLVPFWAVGVILAVLNLRFFDEKL